MMNKKNPLVHCNDVSKFFYTNNNVRQVNLLSIILGKISPLNEKNKVYATHKINFKAYSGERIGIIGENGAGKSTLLQLLSKIINPDEGIIDINGKVTSLLTLGLGLRDDLTGKENIYRWSIKRIIFERN